VLHKLIEGALLVAGHAVGAPKSYHPDIGLTRVGQGTIVARVKPISFLMYVAKQLGRLWRSSNYQLMTVKMRSMTRKGENEPLYVNGVTDTL
jgi:hypothetical protein